MFGLFNKWTSSNFNDRAHGQVPYMLVLHYTGMENAKAALERLCDPESEVSAHYVVEEDGHVHQLVENHKRAWHAGVSSWEGLMDINSASIGIEIVNPGHELGYHPFPHQQIAAVTKLCQNLIDDYDIAPYHVLGHSDVAPERKIDPGELFPWEELAKNGVGFWPNPSDIDDQAAEDLLESKDSFYQLLYTYGYDPSADLKAVIRAYHRHFYPETFAAGETQENIDKVSISKLLSLIRQKNGYGS